MDPNKMVNMCLLADEWKDDAHGHARQMSAGSMLDDICLCKLCKLWAISRACAPRDAASSVPSLELLRLSLRFFHSDRVDSQLRLKFYLNRVGVFNFSQVKFELNSSQLKSCR